VTETRREREDRIYAAAEQKLERVNARRVRRGPETLIAVLVVMSLAVGIVAAIDLRRLNTPRGTALAWTGAAVFGDCTAYDELSIPSPAAIPPVPTGQERCLALRRATESDRANASSIGIDLVGVTTVSEDRAVAEVEIRRPEGIVRAPLQLRRQGDGWGVVVTQELCAQLGCP
jgi:hypothetical protein